MEIVGELGMYYSAADWLLVGTDHSMLEPLACGGTVSVSGHWHSQAHTTYPVFRQALQAGLTRLVTQIHDLGLMSRQAETHQDQTDAEQRRRVGALIAGDQGRVVSLNHDLISEHLPLSPSASA